MRLRSIVFAPNLLSKLRTCITPGLHPPPSKVPVMDPYRHRQLLHDRWINRASQRLGDIATLKYGSIGEFFRVGVVTLWV